MQNPRLAVKQWLRRVTGSIAFFPTIIALAFIVLALLLIWVEYQPWLMDIKESMDVVMVESEEDGRLVLGTLVASTISLMVFSFSMVMVVLNQASANLSPRLLPGLITAKDNQVVMGVYLGTICFCLMLILNIHPDADERRIPGFGILVGLCFGLACLALFAYFIHSISQAIQVDHILDRLLQQTLSKLRKSLGAEKFIEPDTSGWSTLNAPCAGYLKWIQEDELLRLCCEYDVQLQMKERIGYFYVANAPYVRVNKELDQTIAEKVHQCFLFYPQERLGDHYSFGFKQISEVAVKSLSPGINDPATAIKAIDMLVMLFIEKCSSEEICILKDKKGAARIFLQPTSFDDLLRQNITPIREYAKRDPIVMRHLLNGMCKVRRMLRNDGCTLTLVRHAIAVRDSCDEALTNALDRASINEEIETFNQRHHEQALALLKCYTEPKS